jgi:hypothetical protein
VALLEKRYPTISLLLDNREDNLEKKADLIIENIDNYNLFLENYPRLVNLLRKRYKENRQKKNIDEKHL